MTRIPSARFVRADRVLSARDYARVRRRGDRSASKNFAVSVAARDLDESSAPRVRRAESGNPSHTRLGMVVSRKVGNAVVRNRVKRAIREWFRNTGARLAESADIVVVARRGAADRLTSEIDRELSGLMKTGKMSSKPTAKARARK